MSQLYYLLLLTAIVNGCQVGWQAYNGRCFAVFESSKNQAQAQQDCVQRGGQLASVLSEGENTFLRSLSSSKYWIGLEQKFQGCPSGWSEYGGKCFQVCGQLKNWDTAKQECSQQGGVLTVPRDEGENSFVRSLSSAPIWIGFYRVPASERQWIDTYTMSPAWVSVEEGKFVDVDYKNWVVGQPSYSPNHCVQMKTNGEWQHVDCLVEKKFLCSMDIDTHDSFTWVDGTSFGYEHWYPGEPNNYLQSEDCVTVYPDGQWNDDNCVHGRAYACASN